MVGTEDRIESPYFVMPHHADHPFGGHIEVLVTTQVVITSIDSHFIIRHILQFATGHPSAETQSILLFTHLIVECQFGRQLLRLIAQISTYQLLIVRTGIGVIKITLHADVHAQQGDAEWHLGYIIVIPQGFHGFVGLYSACKVVAAVHVLDILVVGTHQVDLMSFLLKSQNKRIV